MSYYFDKQCGWFRIFGFGLSWQNIKYFPLLFSERNGFQNGIIINGYWIKFLTPRQKRD